MSLARIDKVQRDSRRATYWFAAWLGDTARMQINSDQAATKAERSSFAAARLHLPQARLADAEAAIAHYHAHRCYGADRFAVGGLKPIQIVLASLFEDARVEQLAMRARPGLRNLWSPYIGALDCSGNDIPALLRRLAVALFDPVWHDSHPWVDRARRLFLQHSARHSNQPLHDSVANRYLGNLLGNDLGQMRLQFNWKSYVVEPSYRDDHRGLWVEESEPHQIENRRAAIRFDTHGDSVAQLPTGDDNNAQNNEVGEWLAAAPITTPEIKTLPEWDYARGFFREHWVQIREQIAITGASKDVEKLRSNCAAYRFDLTNLIAACYRQRTALVQRRRRLIQGDDLDLDACVNFMTEQRGGSLPNPRVYSQRHVSAAPRSLLILIDASLSSGDILSDKNRLSDKNNLSVLDCARMATLSLLKAAEQGGDQVAVYAFCSDGRTALRMTPIKLFSEKSDGVALLRLAGLQGAFSTRLGAALRYAHHVLAGKWCSDEASINKWSTSKEVLVFTDGEVSDIDSGDPAYLREDARRAVEQLHAENIEVSAVAFSMRSPRQDGNYKNHVSEVLHPIERVFGKSAKLFSFR